MFNIQNRLILAPLTRGGNLPFRRLCKDFGADVTVSEMMYARPLLKGRARERALLRRHPSEDFFGAQIASRKPEEAAAAVKVVVESGADFVDLNCGCPIYDTIRRGMGADLLRHPQRLVRVVEAMVAASSVPVTVKIRSGFKSDKINAVKIATLCRDAGAAAVTLHARSREQRYSRSADWNLVGAVAEAIDVPVIGNGDILLPSEAQERKKIGNCDALMIGRGALIKPWIFEELKRGEEIHLSTRDRVEIYYRLAVYMKEHFRDDEKGRRRAFGFLPWHFDFFTRYRRFGDLASRSSLSSPIIQQREEDTPAEDPVEELLRSQDESLHEHFAALLWDASSAAEAYLQFERLAIAGGEQAGVRRRDSEPALEDVEWG